jgi:hypothetical protein
MANNIVRFFNLDDQSKYQPIPWTPAQISTTAWWDASDISSITESGGLVTALAEQKGGASLTQGTPGQEPSTGLRTIGGLNIIEGAGSLTVGGQHLESISFSLPSSGNISIYMVAIVDSSANNSQSLYSFDATNDFQLDTGDNALCYGRIRTTGIGSNLLMDAVDKIGTQGIWGTVFDFTGGFYYGFYNGTEEGTAQAYGTKIDTSQHLRVLANRAENYALDGGFGELIFVEDVTTATRQLIEGYLAWKWDGGSAGTLVGALPVDHPYKTGAPTA